MDFKVIISQPAITDLRDIVTYIANHNPTAAERLGMALINRLENSRVPEMGRQAPEIRFHRARNCFRPTAFLPVNKVTSQEIIRYWHAARGFPVIPRTEPFLHLQQSSAAHRHGSHPSCPMTQWMRRSLTPVAVATGPWLFGSLPHAKGGSFPI